MTTPRILIDTLLGNIRHIEDLLDEAETTHPHQERLQRIRDLTSTARIQFKDIKDGNRTWARYGLNAGTTELNKLKASIKNIERWELRLRAPTNNQNKEDSAPDNNRSLDISAMEQKNHIQRNTSASNIDVLLNYTRTLNMLNVGSPKDRIRRNIHTYMHRSWRK